eukprot:m51a1_g10659 hypothetical protein (117) ;mRNA; f:46020-46770
MLQSFLGLMQWLSEFIPNFASKAACMYELLWHNVKFESHFDVGDYVLLDKDHDHKLDINIRGSFWVIEKLDHYCYTVKNLLWDFGDDDPRSWISYDNNKNVDQVITYMQAHPHLRT